jgi:predicted nucleic acid-binding protein
VTTFFDATAVVALHIDTAARPLAERSLVTSETVVCVSALSLTEALAVVDRLTDEPALRLDLEDALRGQWDRYAVVPVDQRCLERATVLLREQPVRLADAIQLAAAERLPRPLRYVTFDPVQIPAALGLGFDVVAR